MPGTHDDQADQPKPNVFKTYGRLLGYVKPYMGLVVAILALTLALSFMAVLPIQRQGATVYRVLVGPLEQDETGLLLRFLRAKGYRDTFVRSGTEL